MKVAINPPVRIVIEIEGKEYQCRKPKNSEIVEHEMAMKAAEASNQSQAALLHSFLEKCGLPPEVTKALDSDQTMQVIEALQPAKKN